MRLTWPSKWPEEVFVNGLDWVDLLDGVAVTSVEAEALDAGDIVLNDPAPTFMEGTVQRVWVSGGTRGRKRVLLTANLADGRVLQEVVGFQVNS